MKAICLSVSVSVKSAMAVLRVGPALSPILALFYRCGFVGAAGAAQRRVAVRETPETVDDVEMFLRIIGEHRVGELAHQPQRFALVGDILAMFKGQVGELAAFVGPALVPT